ncbi:MAG: ATP-binding protein [Aestuariivita sp.]|nr:ATP-binding protein [Aestuariivita sp.]
MAKKSSEPPKWPPGFTIDQERVLELLTGVHFYTDASAALREAVLNAVDAINRRIDENSKEFTPKIHVILNRDSLSLEVSDNGIGMDRSDITNLFSKVGMSASKTETNPNAVGEFGIGVISYFMAGELFQLETVDRTGNPIGLEFSKSLFSGGTATEFASSRAERGTTIRIALRSPEIFNLLEKKFSHWCRDVTGLSARIDPDGRELRQRGVEQGDTVNLKDLPKWAERVLLRPVSNPTGWDAMTGNSTVAVLYKGVFVQELEVQGIWGIEGSIDVDPKYFKPQLNREGFIPGEFTSEVTNLLRVCHPEILKSMISLLEIALSEGVLVKWHARRWASLWLAIPRSPEYKEATDAWDSVFKTLPAFEALSGDDWVPISFSAIEYMGDEIYVAPIGGDDCPDTVYAAIRLLYGMSKPIVRGFRREDHWLQNAEFIDLGSTADLIFEVFKDIIPEFVNIPDIAEEILKKIAKEHQLLTGPPAVNLVQIGNDTAPVLRLQDRLLVNIDHEAGASILEETLEENRGHISLITYIAKHAPNQIQDALQILLNFPKEIEYISPIRRRFIIGRFRK